MASARLSAQWRDDFAIQFAHCANGKDLQAVADELHRQKHRLTNDDYTILRHLYRRAVERLKETQK